MKLAASTVSVPMGIIVCRTTAAWPEAMTMPLIRQRATRAQFKSAPESMAEAGAGASLWASGSQLCRGNNPALVP